MTESTYTPPPISGYRKLTQTEVDLINDIKDSGHNLSLLIESVSGHVSRQVAAANKGAGSALGDDVEALMAHEAEAMNETFRIHMAEPMRWISIARTDLQRGLMALTRAVAQPGGF